MSYVTTRKSVQSAGAHAKAAKIRARYLESPRHCLCCGTAILPSDPEAIGWLRLLRKKKFCSRSCAASYNNSTQHFPKRTARRRICRKCDTRLERGTRRVLCVGCFNKHHRRRSLYSTKNERSHAETRDHARSRVAGRLRRCAVCGYIKYLEVAHIRPVSDFPGSALLAEINHLSNLVLLCPNHHKEYDKGLADDQTIEKLRSSATNGSAP